MFVRRWSLRSKVMALLAVVAGAASFTLVRGYAAGFEALRPTAGDTVQVVVADRDLERGTVIDDASVRVERMPSAFAPPGALRTVDDRYGRTPRLGPGGGRAPCTGTPDGRGGPVASLVAGGLRAFVVGSGLPSGVLEPGDRVDVIATFGGPHPYTATVGSGLEGSLTIVEQDGETFQAGGATVSPSSCSSAPRPPSSSRTRRRSVTSP